MAVDKSHYKWYSKMILPVPSTIVDRLRGIYPSAIGPYTASPLEREAADEIEFLHNLLAKLNIKTDKYRVNRE